ncbi:hypothetical protein SAMN05444007_108248 [Cribrihabitans marinus]|uniref:Uncharacterized protein n=1 Tax=Cribrihabitans marinus TaxID=1227549 RepID=A0A1H7CQ24_9RHOB|nr:hypothetical protein [Cribrihabitans marinus]GGH36315.1 hypothetical protein GCM10010973_30180 [Cribrihabitans marinus]SEJ91576.1 hypothetical protein SAMN05444007_108248 [Cribrihabitans marinus]
MKPEFWNLMTMPRPVWAPDDDGAGGGAGDGGDASGDGDGTGDVGDGGGADGGGGSDGGDQRWWEGKGLTDEQRTSLTRMGLTVEDPVEAVAKLTDMEIAAQRKLSKPADQLMDRPTKDQDVAEWMRANGDMFGIPDDPEKYEIVPPKDWPKDLPWNKDLEAEARKIAHEHGIGGNALQAFSDLQAQAMLKLSADAETELQAANDQLQADLKKDWGDQYGAKVAQAQQAASVVAEAAGLDAEGIANLAAVLKPKVGDANTMRMFAAIGELMGEDGAAGLNKGGNTLGTTPADARAELAKMQSKDGAWYRAVESGDQTEIKRLQPKMDQLRKLAAG